MLYFGNTQEYYDENGQLVSEGLEYLAYPGDSELLILMHEQYDEILSYAQDINNPTNSEWFRGLNTFYKTNYRHLDIDEKRLIERWLDGLSQQRWPQSNSNAGLMY